MNQQATASQKTRAEQETENEANRLREQIDAALAAVALRSPDEIESLQSLAGDLRRWYVTGPFTLIAALSGPSVSAA